MGVGGAVEDAGGMGAGAAEAWGEWSEVIGIGDSGGEECECGRTNNEQRVKGDIMMNGSCNVTVMRPTAMVEGPGLMGVLRRVEWRRRERVVGEAERVKVLDLSWFAAAGGGVVIRGGEGKGGVR